LSGIAPTGQCQADGRAVDRSIREKEQPFDHVAELADIAGPGVALQLFDCLGLEGLDLPAVLIGHLSGEMRDQRGNVLGALAERRQQQGEDVDPMIEILPERAFLDELIEVAMSGHDDADVDRDGAVATHTLDLPLLEHAQELGLHDHGHVADFVEEEGAVVGLLELADVAGGRAGERAFLVAEEFGLDQLARDGGAVERDERPGVARASLMKRAGDELLASAGIAENADAGFAGGDTIDLSHNAAHGFTRVDDLMLADTLSQFAILILEAFELKHVVDGEEQLAGGERLLEEIDCAELGGADGHLDIGLAGDHHDRQGDAEVAEIFKEREAVLARHDDVREHHVERLRFDQIERAARVIADGGFVTGEAEGAREGRKRVRVVVDYQEVCQL
jgi:hypothetical protein